MAARVVFAHGKESGPWGTKITALAAIARELGWAVDSPDYRFSHDPDERAAHLQALAPTGEPLVLAGSSLGGYVSLKASRQLRPAALFLMAPAIYIPERNAGAPPADTTLVVVHGRDDAIVPPAHSERFCREHHADLHLIRGDHGLNARLGVIGALFRALLLDL
ncbi:MAG: YqiA/YcfP family alpha/beta fold hydrolase [Pseudomonadota bacterium]|nr:YqiA/YcfP family alpha/beta fold hydrolase [Pseudomonadota bacterium]